MPTSRDTEKFTCCTPRGPGANESSIQHKYESIYQHPPLTGDFVKFPSSRVESTGASSCHIIKVE